MNDLNDGFVPVYFVYNPLYAVRFGYPEVAIFYDKMNHLATGEIGPISQQKLYMAECIFYILDGKVVFLKNRNGLSATMPDEDLVVLKLKAVPF